MHDDGRSAFGMVGRLVGLVTMAVIAACGFVWISTPQPVNSGFAPAAYEKPAAGEEPDAAAALNNTSFNAPSSNNGSFKPAVFRSPPVQAEGLKVDMMRPRDEAPPADRPQVLAPVLRSVPDGGRDLANTPRDTHTSDVAMRSVVSAPADTSLRGSPAAESQTAPRSGIEVWDAGTAPKPPRGKCFHMALKLSQHETEVSRWDLWQTELAPFAHWSHPRFGLFLLIVFAGNVVVATLVWLLVGLFMR
jgi:hypothetical protein